MQAGFAAGSHLGTSLDTVQPSKFGARFKDSFSNQVFQNSLNSIESVSERDIVFPKFATALQGMTLTRVPNGGFSTPSKIMLGTPPMTTQFSNPNYFLQPGGPEKRVEITSGLPLVSETGGPFLTKAPKTRPGHGASTLKRAQQEATLGQLRMHKARLAMYADDDMVPATPNAAAQHQQAATPLASPSSMEQQPAPVAPVTPLPPPAVRAPSATQFLAEVGMYVQGKLAEDRQAAFWATYWPYVVNIIFLFLFFILMIVLVVIAARSPMAAVVQSPAAPEPVFYGDRGQSLTGLRPYRA